MATADRPPHRAERHLKLSMTKHPLAALLPLLVPCALLSACFVPASVVHATLRISPSGAYELDGRALAPAQLAAAIAARQAGAPSLVIEVQASPAADMAAVRAALQSVRSAHARVAFAAFAPA